MSTSLEDGPQANMPADLPADPAQSDPDAITAQAKALSDRVANVSAQINNEPPREIIWRDLAVEPAAQTPIESKPAKPQAAEAQPTDTDTAPAQPEPELAQANIQTVAIAKPDLQAKTDTPSVAQAYRQMLRALQQSDSPNLDKAIAAATLGVAGPHGELDWTLMQSLSPQDQERVQAYHRAISLLHDEALSGKGPVDRAAVAGKLEELFGTQPVTIRNIELCERVSGYGVYDTFPDHTFVAGREHKMIVYVELDNFLPADRGQGEGYEVRLRQEVELYESNGYEVWSHEPVHIVDASKNKRRDFFVVQLVTLPPQLALGEYRMKVRVYDENAGTRDETSIKLTITADDTLVKKTTR